MTSCDCPKSGCVAHERTLASVNGAFTTGISVDQDMSASSGPGSKVSLPRASSLRRSFLLAALRGLHLLRSLRPVARGGSRTEPTKGARNANNRSHATPRRIATGCR